MAWELDVPHPDHAIAARADRQHGVVARRELLADGVSANEIDRRIRVHRLLRVHRGVYAVGHRRLHRDGAWMAAVLAAGPGAVLSHRDAAALHGLRRLHDGRTDVTTTTRSKSTKAIRVHQTTALPDRDITSVAGIPVTSIARTLVDLASVVGRQQLAAALTEAERANVLDVEAVEETLIRTTGRRGRGHATLNAVLAEHAARGAQLTRSELERAFLDLLAAHDLPRPTMNAIRDRYEVDASWPEQRLIVELDGCEFHRTRREFERDRAKDATLTANGWRVIRITHRQLTEQPAKIASQLNALLDASRSPR